MQKKKKIKHFLIPHTKLTKYIIDTTVNAKGIKNFRIKYESKSLLVYITAESGLASSAGCYRLY